MTKRAKQRTTKEVKGFQVRKSGCSMTTKIKRLEDSEWMNWKEILWD